MKNYSILGGNKRPKMRGSRRDMAEDKRGFLIWFWLDRRVTAQWTGAELRGYCSLAHRLLKTGSQKGFVYRTDKWSDEVRRGGRNTMHYIFTLRESWEIMEHTMEAKTLRLNPTLSLTAIKLFRFEMSISPLYFLTMSLLSILALSEGECLIRRATNNTRNLLLW